MNNTALQASSPTTSDKIPAAPWRRFPIGQRVLTQVWAGGANQFGQSGWEAELVYGTVVDSREEYDTAPDAPVLSWMVLVIEATGLDGKPCSYNRTSSNTIPLPN
jgi:hypothetical protein